MSDTPIVQLLADRFTSGIAHPGEDGKATLLNLPIRNSAIPPEMSEHFAQSANLPHADLPKLLAEAVVHTLKTEGKYAIIPQAQLDELQARADGGPDGTRVIEVYESSAAKQPVFTLRVEPHTDRVNVPLNALRAALQARGE